MLIPRAPGCGTSGRKPHSASPQSHLRPRAQTRKQRRRCASHVPATDEQVLRTLKTFPQLQVIDLIGSQVTERTSDTTNDTTSDTTSDTTIDTTSDTTIAIIAIIAIIAGTGISRGRVNRHNTAIPESAHGRVEQARHSPLRQGLARAAYLP